MVNVTGTRVLGGKAPHEKLFCEVPSIKHLRTWGCLLLVTVLAIRKKE
ncbi:TPA: hypothetical protein N0F65_000243 [Lagenidium giganteum]|uniref:Uncharacterized protein n=1 Tax=Lagenidium giganteum TaxID=4803 RepID=A0AAV2Z6R2_9STRA|nr:TPA: hypothetical protein N0F65_000243 [Lagenidium giganteum]